MKVLKSAILTNCLKANAKLKTRVFGKTLTRTCNQMRSVVFRRYGDGVPRLPPGNPEGVLQYRVEAASRCPQDAFPDFDVRAESDGTHWTFALCDSSRMHHVVRFTDFSGMFDRSCDLDVRRRNRRRTQPKRLRACGHHSAPWAYRDQPVNWRSPDAAFAARTGGVAALLMRCP